jgi:hypothetical protein
MKHPEPQVPPLQTSPVPQLVPSAALLHTDVLVAGTQLWHALFGLGASRATGSPAMTHPAPESRTLASPEPMPLDPEVLVEFEPPDPDDPEVCPESVFSLEPLCPPSTVPPSTYARSLMPNSAPHPASTTALATSSKALRIRRSLSAEDSSARTPPVCPSRSAEGR